MRQGSRSAAGLNDHPQAVRSYVLRSYLTCDICSRRMFGKTRHKKTHDLTYYACVTNRQHHQTEAWYADHPANVLVNEDQILPLVNDFFARRVFGTNRRAYLADRIADIPRQRTGNPRLAALGREIKELQQAEANLKAQLEAFRPSGDEDIDAGWRSRLQHRFTDVVKARRRKMDDLAELGRTGAKIQPVNPDLIDRLPQVAFDLGALPEAHQRRLFDAFQLELRYNRIRHELTIRVTVRGDMIHQLRGAVAAAWRRRLAPKTADRPKPDNRRADPFPKFWVPPAGCPVHGHVWSFRPYQRGRPARGRCRR
jgi:hypothetical protein